MTTKARTNADNASADIEGVTAGSGITGGGTSGTVSVAVDSTVLRTTGGQTVTVASGTTVPLTIQNNGTGSSFVINDVASDTTPFIVDADGNVGIGTSSPSSANKLDVVGDATDRRIAMRTQNTSGIASVEAQVNNYWSGSTFTGTALVQYDSAAGGTVVGLSGNNLGALRFQNGSAGLIYTNGATPIVFGTSATERMRIDGSGNTTINAIADATTTTAARGGGYMGIPQSAASGSGAYTIVAADAGEHIYTTTTRTVTIPANSSVAFPVGTVLTFISGVGATTTIAITTDTMYLAGPGTTGSRTLAPHGMATAVKVASTTWYISGNGLT